MRTAAKIALGVVALVVISAAVGAVYTTGVSHGKLACEAKQTKSNDKAQKKANVKTAADLKRADKTGNDQEANRAALDRTFANLEKDASHEAADPVDSCVLPDARLRRWNSANAGRVDSAGEGATASKPDAGPFAATGSAFWGGARLGGQPPVGEQGLPLAGRPDVQPAGVSGGQP